MVKKASILKRLKGRFLSGSGVRVEERAAAGKTRSRGAAPRPGNGASAGRAAGNRVAEPLEPVEPVEAVDRALPAQPVAERVSSRKMSSKDAAAVALGESFQELAGMMRGVQGQFDEHGRRTDALAVQVGKLPALGQAQLELLQQMAKGLERQGQVGDAMLKTFGGLPEVLDNVRQALDRAAAADERTASTVGEFRSTMESIETSMGRMVEQSKAAGESLVREQKQGNERVAAAMERGAKIDTSALEASVDGLRTAQGQAAERLEQSSTAGIEALRRAQEDQANRLNKLVAQSGSMNRFVVVLLVLTLFAVLGAIGVMALR